MSEKMDIIMQYGQAETLKGTLLCESTYVFDVDAAETLKGRVFLVL
jgi:hypothetical protein